MIRVVTGGRRRHVRRRSPWVLELLGYGAVGIGGGLLLAVLLGATWWQAVLAAAGLLLVLLLAVGLERSGVMRLTYLDERRDDDAGSDGS